MNCILGGSAFGGTGFGGATALHSSLGYHGTWGSEGGQGSIRRVSPRGCFSSSEVLEIDGLMLFSSWVCAFVCTLQGVRGRGGGRDSVLPLLCVLTHSRNIKADLYPTGLWSPFSLTLGVCSGGSRGTEQLPPPQYGCDIVLSSGGVGLSLAIPPAAIWEREHLARSGENENKTSAWMFPPVELSLQIFSIQAELLLSTMRQGFSSFSRFYWNRLVRALH